jgi:DNA-binding response OmpR family regulator
VSPPRVLVLEDDSTIREAVAEALARRKIAVDEADTVERFRELLAGEAPALALMDRHVRGMDALELLDEVWARRPGLPVVMMSSAAAPEDVRAVLARGVRSFLAKPFALATLVATVEEALQRKRP